MVNITVERTLCKRDGFCVATCPFVVLTTDAEGYPITSPESERNCINCGHCVAICPTAALEHGLDAIKARIDKMRQQNPVREPGGPWATARAERASPDTGYASSSKARRA